MVEKKIRRSLAILPMGSVTKLTSLSARQIRYYDDQGLVKSTRTASNRRLYSLNDIDRILEINDYLSEGMSIEQVKRVYEKQKIRVNNKQKAKNKFVSDKRAREYLHDDILRAGGLYDDNNQF